MKHFLIVWVWVLWGCYIFADVKLEVIYNHSPLTLTSVLALPSKKKIKSVTGALKVHNKSKSVQAGVFDTIPFNYTISKELKGSILIEAQDVHKNKYEISIHINPTIAVHGGRAKTTHGRPEIVKALCEVTDGNQCAHVVITKNGIHEFTGALAYDIDNPQEDVTLHLSLIESKGIYTARLTQLKS